MTRLCCDNGTDVCCCYKLSLVFASVVTLALSTQKSTARCQGLCGEANLVKGLLEIVIELMQGLYGWMAELPSRAYRLREEAE